MSDAELIALAALVNAEVENMRAENMQREHLGQSMAYDSYNSKAWDALDAELTRRGVV